MDIATLKIAIDTREAMAARRDLASVESQAAKTEQATVRMAKQSNQALGDMSGFIGRVAGALAAANLAQQFIGVADSVTVLNNQLKLAMGTAQAAGQAYKDLYIIAQQSRVSFTSLGGTFAQIRRATEDTGLSYGRLLTVTEAIGNAMAVSGGSAQGMNAALIQLQQGLASGTLRGEELNSVMEQTPRLAQAIADGLGITRGQLRAMGADGKLTSDAVIRALESQAGVLKGEVANATLTAGQAYTVMANGATKLIGQFDQLTGASAGVASAMKSVGSAMDGLGAFIEKNQAAILAVTGALAGAAVVAGIVKMAGAIGLVTAAFTALTAVMAANPVGLVLLGIGAVGGAIAGINAYNNAFAKTREGMVETIKRLEETNKSVEKSIYGPPTAAAMQHVEARRKQIEGLRKEIEKLDAAAIKAGGGSGSVGSGDTALMREQGKAYAAMAGERQKFIDGAMTATQKMNAELEKARTAFGGMIPKNVEESIRGKYAGAIEKATDETRKLIDAGIELQKSLTAKDSGLSPEFSKQWESLGAAYKSGKLSIDQVLESQRLLLEQQPFMIDAAKREADAIKEAAKAQEATAKREIKLAQDTQKAYEDGLKPYLQAAKAAEDRVKSLETEEAALQISESMNVSLAQAVEMVNIAKLKERQIDAMGNEDAVAAIQTEIEAREKLVKLIGSKEARDASTRAAEKAATDWQRAADKIQDSITDALMRGFESGKSFAQVLKDTVVNMFKTMVLRPVIQGIVGGATGLGAAAAQASGIGGQASMLSNAFSAASTAGTAFTLGSQVLAGTMSVANAAATAFCNTASIVFGDGLSALLATNGAYGTAAAAGTGSSMMANAAAAGPYVLAAVAVLNALGVFKSNKVVGGGISGTLGGDDLEAYDLNRRGGSLVSGPSYSLRNEGPTQETQALNNAFLAIRTSTAQMAKDLGFATAQIDAFTMSVGDVKVHPDIDRLGLVLDGLTDQQKLAKIEEVLQKSGNAMAELVLGAGATSQQLAQLYASVMQQRAGLEMQLLQAQGNVTEIRKRERDALHESNRAIYDQIKAIEGQKIANEAATKASEAARAEQATAAAERARATDLALTALQKSISAEQSAVQKIVDRSKASIDALGSIMDMLSGHLTGLRRQVVMDFEVARANAGIDASLALLKAGGVIPSQAVLSDQISLVRQSIDDQNYSTRVEAEYARLELVNRLKALRDQAGEQLSQAERDHQTQLRQLDSLNELLQAQQNQIDVMRGVDISVQGVTAAVAALQAAMFAELSGTAPGGSLPKGGGGLAGGGLGKVVVGGGGPDSRVTVDPGTIAQGYSRNYSASEIQAIRANFLATGQTDPAELVRLMDQFSVTTKDLALAMGGDLRGYEMLVNRGRTGSDGYTPAPDSAAWAATEAGQAAGGITSVYDSINQFLASSPSQYALMAAMLEYGVSAETLAAAQAYQNQFATGAAFTNGIVSRPTAFNMGVMGEAGPEAIMPLASIGGSLGIRAQMPGADSIVDELRGLREEVSMLRAEARATALNTGRTQDIMKRVSRNGDSFIVSTDGEALEVTT